MKWKWWKIACVVLLGFTFSAGILVPLSPGTLIVPSKANIIPTAAGPFTVKILGYNTRFKENEASVSAWLSNWSDHHVIHCCPSAIRVKDNTHLELDFLPLAPLDSLFFPLAVYDNADGLISSSVIYTTSTDKGSIVPTCRPEVKNFNPDYFGFPFRIILYESIRNLFFHVPMWFTMIALLSWAVFNNIRFLNKFDLKYDRMANEAVNTGLIFGILGLITGSLWARSTWGAWWVDDVKLNGTAITMLAYLAYVVLRNAMDDEQKRARVSAIYSIFAYVMMIVLIGILPRLKGTDSLHPGNGGNPAFSSYDLDNTLRMVFYPAVLGWILLGTWIYNIRFRMRTLQEKISHA